MRRVAITLLFSIVAFSQSPAEAETILLPGTGGNFTINGMPDGNFSFTGFFDANITLTSEHSLYDYSNPYSSSYYIFATIGNFGQMEGCGSNAIDAHCGRALHYGPSTTALATRYHTSIQGTSVSLARTSR
jgi:hypothetical protein